MMSAMDGFNLLFKSRAAPLRWARNAGLSLVNAAPPVKQAFMCQAMGMKGDLPALARVPGESSAAG
jgi:2-octaprenylphenol hydroxylase